MVKKIDTLLCQVRDMNRAITFYKDVLLLQPRTTSPFWSDFELGGITIGLHPPFSHNATGAHPGGGSGWILGFEVEDLYALKERLLNGRAVVGELSDVPGGAVLEFADPDGNQLQAIERGVTKAIVEAR